MIIMKKENVERLVSSMEDAKKLMLDGYELLKEEKEDNFTVEEDEVLQEALQDKLQEDGIEIELEEEKEDQKGKKRLK